MNCEQRYRQTYESSDLNKPPPQMLTRYMDMRISIALIKITLNVKLKLEVQPVNQFSDLKGEIFW